MHIKPIAYFHSPFSEKFGVPKQSLLVKGLEGNIIFEPAYRDVNMLRGLEDFDYIWLIWGFSANSHEARSALVRPPLLGGNQKVGVFSSRSPYRPNALGLSSVKIKQIEWGGAQGPNIHVLGGDLMNGTPIYDIKPYISLSDSHSQARCGFVDRNTMKILDVILPENIADVFSADQISVLSDVLSLDPRPHYQNNENRIYGMSYYGKDIKFKVNQNILTVIEVKS